MAQEIQRSAVEIPVSMFPRGLHADTTTRLQAILQVLCLNGLVMCGLVLSYCTALLVMLASAVLSAFDQAQGPGGLPLWAGMWLHPVVVHQPQALQTCQPVFASSTSLAHE